MGLVLEDKKKLGLIYLDLLITRLTEQFLKKKQLKQDLLVPLEIKSLNLNIFNQSVKSVTSGKCYILSTLEFLEMSL